MSASQAERRRFKSGHPLILITKKLEILNLFFENGQDKFLLNSRFN